MAKINVVLFLKRLIILFLVLACSACDSEKAGLKELKRLCKKDAGLKIYKTVEADGYYDTSQTGGVLRTLIPSKFNFIEFCNFDPGRPSFDETGCWRLTKVSREAGQCNERVDGALRSSGGYSYPEFRQENCISVKKIEKPAAEYSFHSDFRKWPAKNEVSEFTRSDVYIKSVANDEILGRYVNYSYNVKPRHSTAKSCEIFNGDYPSYLEANLIESVIKPMQE